MAIASHPTTEFTSSSSTMDSFATTLTLEFVDLDFELEGTRLSSRPMHSVAEDLALDYFDGDDQTLRCLNNSDKPINGYAGYCIIM
jgi:hypothetical protein